MAQYINDTTTFDNYASSISYNLDKVQFTIDTLTDTISIKTETSDSANIKTFNYDVITHYTNKIDLSVINTINLKLTNNYTQTDDYLITDLYIAKANENSLGVLNEDIALTIDATPDAPPTKYMYKYFIITRFSPLKGNSLSVENNIYIITPLLYTNTNINTVSQSSNIVLSVKTIDNNQITELESPEINITNVNNINEIIRSDSDYFFIDSIDKVVIFKNPLYIGIKPTTQYTGNLTTLTTPNELLYLLNGTEYTDSANIINNSSSGIIKNNAIGQTSANLDSNIYINCHPVDESGRLVPKSNNSQKSKKDIEKTILAFGVFFTFIVFCYFGYAIYNKELVLSDVINFNLINENITNVRIKYGIMFMVVVICWIFMIVSLDTA
jgi:hypothetical protein